MFINGSQAQKIPPTTSKSDNRLNSPDNNLLEPMLYKIKPHATKRPWVILSIILLRYKIFQYWFYFLRLL